jgi:SAM-dependent methyltransferase
MRKFLAYAQLRDHDLDDPRTTLFHREILRKNYFLKQIYIQWYQEIAREIPEGTGEIVEIGSGPGFLRDYINGLIASDVFLIVGNQLVMNGGALPFKNRSLRAIVLTNVMHHIPDVARFFSEASRCLIRGGRIIMIEPWITGWSEVIFRHFHHETLDISATSWDFPYTGPLSSANEALPWIVFHRDRRIFNEMFPQYGIIKIKQFMPFLYILSGGFSSRFFMPSWSYPFWKKVEDVLKPWNPHLAMFATIVVSMDM